MDRRSGSLRRLWLLYRSTLNNGLASATFHSVQSARSADPGWWLQPHRGAVGLRPTAGTRAGLAERPEKGEYSRQFGVGYLVNTKGDFE
jgi:hypothetical protein